VTLPTFAAQVSRVQDLTHDVRMIDLELRDPPAIHFQAGQFVSFSVTTPRFPHPITRAYSIASPPRQSRVIQLLFNRVPNGPGSSYLFSLQVGEAVTFQGPVGSFVLREYRDRGLLFVATGTGIAPMRSMILARLPSPTPVRLFWGLRHERDLYYQDELGVLAAQHPEFSFTMVLSRPSSGWLGATGHVQQLIESRITSVDDLAVYICGNSAMIESVIALIRARGVCPVHYEQYYLDSHEKTDTAHG
jgi:NAD(P)H-flavin reductase